MPHDEAIGCQPEQAQQLGIEMLMQCRVQLTGGQDQRGLRIGDDRLQTGQGPHHPRRIRRRQRHGDHAGLQTAKEGDQKIDALRIEQ